MRRRKSAASTLAALKSIRKPDRTGHRSTSSLTTCPRTRSQRSGRGRPGNKVELCFTPTYASLANPIEAQFGPLRTFVIAGSNHPNHPVLAHKLQTYLRWRNANARHPDVLAAQRRERARIRSERQRRWGQPATPSSLTNTMNARGHGTRRLVVEFGGLRSRVPA